MKICWLRPAIALLTTSFRFEYKSFAKHPTLSVDLIYLFCLPSASNLMNLNWTKKNTKDSMNWVAVNYRLTLERCWFCNMTQAKHRVQSYEAIEVQRYVNLLPQYLLTLPKWINRLPDMRTIPLAHWKVLEIVAHSIENFLNTEWLIVHGRKQRRIPTLIKTDCIQNLLSL